MKSIATLEAELADWQAIRRHKDACENITDLELKLKRAMRRKK